jgi:uncharacterized protein YbbC (DUF1343 family)
MLVGIDVLLRDAAKLRGRKVGLLSHQAALCADGASSAQALHALLGDGLTALFGPEHGFFGLAGPGQRTFSQPHPDWGIPVHSLYGKCRKPTPEMLAGLDALVLDLQDIGVRCYTYLGTLKLALEACAENGVEAIVADRPIPLPDCVDGPMADPAAFSFVAPCAVPMAYGMTQAETARWLAASIPDLRLSVIPMQGWTRRDTVRGRDWPSFLPPSPAIRTWETAATYPALVFAEAFPALDCGRGTNAAFRAFGASWIHAEPLCRRLAESGCPGIAFHPYRFVGSSQTELDGVRLTVTDPAAFKPIQASLVILRAIEAEYGAEKIWQGDGARPDWFDKLYGGPATRLAFNAGAPLAGIFADWQAARRGFLAARQSCLLYS